LEAEAPFIYHCHQIPGRAGVGALVGQLDLPVISPQPQPRSPFFCVCPSCACSVDATPKRPAVFYHRGPGPLLVDLHVEPEVVAFLRYYYEVCSLSGNFLASDYTQCILPVHSKSVSSRLLFGDHVPLHQHTTQNLSARMYA
jgi:hypothetical protein